MPDISANAKKYLIFLLQGARYALDLAQVAEITDLEPLWPIPLAPAYYRGAMNFHGDIFAVIDLAQFMALPGHSQPEKIVVVHHRSVALAFLVGTILRISPEDEVQVRPPSGALLADSTLSLVDGEVTLLDLEALVYEAEIALQKNN